MGSGFGRHTTAAEIIVGIDLSDKNFIVTGGYSGIGLETVRALVNAGATVTVPAGSGTVNSTTLTGATTATISFTPRMSGQVTFTLTNPDGGSASRPVSVSTLASRPLPTLSTISPVSPTKGRSVNFIVTGTDFDPAAVFTVSWTGDGLVTLGPALYRSPTEVGFTGVTNGGNNKSANITVTVTNPGQTAVSKVFTVTTTN